VTLLVSFMELTENHAYHFNITPTHTCITYVYKKGHIPSFRAIFMELELVTWPINMSRVHIAIPLVGLKSL